MNLPTLPVGYSILRRVKKTSQWFKTPNYMVYDTLFRAQNVAALAGIKNPTYEYLVVSMHKAEI